MITIARRDFTYLADSDATIETPLGDARLKLEREPPQRFNVLAIDAFSSDAIPLHLITSEAVAIYKRHLAPGGVIAFHVTNRFLDLVPVVEALAQSQRSSRHPHRGRRRRRRWRRAATGCCSPKTRQLLERPELADFAKPIVPRTDWRLWTDEYNNIVQALK